MKEVLNELERRRGTAREGGGKPDPSVQAGRRDAAEIGPDIAPIGEPGAISEQQAADDRGRE